MVKEVIDSTNTYKKRFLKLFRIDKVNGLSPLMVEMKSPEYICTLVVDLFKPPPKIKLDQPTNNSNSDTSDKGGDNVIVVNDEESNSNNYTFMTPTSMVNIFRTHRIDSQVTKGCCESNDDKNEENDNKYEESLGAGEVVYMGQYYIENSFYKGKASESLEENFLDELRSLLTSYNTAEINLQCLKLMKLTDLGTIENLLIRFHIKVKSFQQQWFRSQKKRKFN